MKSPKEQEQHETRDRIIAAAYKILAAKGYEATTLREIARESGAAQGLVHYYFGGKDQLLIEVLKAGGDLYTQATTDLIETVDPAQFLATALDLAFARITQESEWYRLRYELFALGLHNPTLASSVSDLLAEGRRSIHTAIVFAAQRTRSDSTQAEHEEPPVDASALAAILLAVFDGLALQKILNPQVDLDASHRLLLKMLQYVLTNGA